MRYFIGVDEAGYGPNLGPLVIAASCWSAPDELGNDLYAILQDAVVSRLAKRGERKRTEHLVIADSKTVYQGAHRKARLERGVLASLATAGELPGGGPSLWTGRGLWERLLGGVEGEISSPPWNQVLAQPLPSEAAHEEVESGRRMLAGCLAATGVSLQGVRAAVLFPGEFNRRVEAEQSKGAVLSHTTIDLIAQMLADCTPENAVPADVMITCDKHGGRNHYAPLLMPLTAGQLVETRVEGRSESSYRWRDGERRIEIGFFTKGERFLPTALASMAAKYLRELSMRAFNSFWCEHLPTLKPTAGYPHDARRFAEQTRVMRQKLNIADAEFWRNR